LRGIRWANAYSNTDGDRNSNCNVDANSDPDSNVHAYSNTMHREM
jgi:hypothetical protein